MSHELMSDEEDIPEGFKVKSPHWRSNELSKIITAIDQRMETAIGVTKKAPVKKRRLPADSPMKRKPKKVKNTLLRVFDEDEDVSEDEETQMDNWLQLLIFWRFKLDFDLTFRSPLRIFFSYMDRSLWLI